MRGDFSNLLAKARVVLIMPSCKCYDCLELLTIGTIVMLKSNVI